MIARLSGAMSVVLIQPCHRTHCSTPLHFSGIWPVNQCWTCPSDHVPTFKVFESFQKFNTLHTQCTAVIMISKPLIPVHATIWSRELGKNAALEPNLHPDTSESGWWSDPQLVNEPSYFHSQRESHCSTWSDGQSALDHSQDDLKHPNNGKPLFGLFLPASAGRCSITFVKGNLWRHSSGSVGGTVFTNCCCPCPPHANCFTILQQNCQGMVDSETIQGNVEAKLASQQQWRKQIPVCPLHIS